MVCYRFDVTEGLKRVYVIGLCHYHEKNMPSLAHCSQDELGDKQKVWNKTKPQATPHLAYPTLTRPSDTSKRNKVGPGIKAGPGLSLCGVAQFHLCASLLPLRFLDVTDWPSLNSGATWGNHLWPGGGLWWPLGSSARAWDQPEMDRVGHFHIISAMCKPGTWWPSKILCLIEVNSLEEALAMCLCELSVLCHQK